MIRLQGGFWAVVWGVLLGVSSGCNQGGPSADEIPVGMVAPLTGAVAEWGEAMRNGAIMAIEEINAEGGVLGKPLRLFVENNNSIPTESSKLYESLVNDRKVVTVIGEIQSKATMNMGPLASRNQVPLLTPGSTSDELTRPEYDWVYRVCFKDSFQGDVIAKFAVQQLGAKRVAIIYNQQDDYSTGLAQNARRVVKELGAEVIEDVAYSTGDTDFKAILNRVARADVQAVLATGYYREMGTMIRQARQVGITVPFVGGDGWSASQFLEIGGEALNGCFYSDHFVHDTQEPNARRFVDGYREKFKVLPNSMAPLGYDAVYVLKAAIEKAQSTDPAKIREALAKVEITGVTGKLKMGPDRSMIKPAVMVRIEDGKIFYHATVDP